MKKTLNDFNEDNCMQVAAASSYYMLFSLPATMTIVIAVAGTVFEPADVRGRVANEIRNIVGDAGAEQVMTMLLNSKMPGGGLFASLVGICTLLFGATGVLLQLQEAINTAWNIKPRRDERFYIQFMVKRMVSFAMLIGIGFILIVSLTFDVILTAINDKLSMWLPEGAGRSVLWIAHLVVTYSLLIAFIAGMYRYLPDTRIDWKDVWVGAVFTVTLFVIGKEVLAVYLGRTDITSAYGAAGSLALILLWLFYSNLIFLLGVELTQAWTRRNVPDVELTATV
ncbi:MAG: YihY/virulence factor BrkB family protein [Planctomycetaceae bacterium]